MSTVKVLAAAVGVSVVAAVVAVWGFGVGTEYYPELPKPTPRAAASRPARGPATAANAVSEAAYTTLFREIPRQAMLIATVERAGRAAVDRSVDFAGVTAAGPLSCTTKYVGRRGLVEVVVFDAAGKTTKSLELPVAVLSADTPDYAKAVAKAEGWIDTEFAKLLDQPAARPTTAPGGSVPAEIEDLLRRIDPQSAFLAARQLHARIAESGESPERLAALVRAYAHLAESTRFLYSRHSSACFARALIYAQRGVRQHPDSVLAHSARGYAFTLLGLPVEGRAALDRARGVGDLPEWAKVADDLNHFRTRELVDRATAKDAQSTLATYFALLTVEHSGLQSIVVNLGRLALADNPAAVRVVNILADNGGVSLQHEVTPLYWPTLFASMGSLSARDDVPAKVKSAAIELKRFDPAVANRLLSTMDAEPAENGQLLSWGTYASIVRDAMYVAAIRRGYFESDMLATGGMSGLQAVWPLVKDHRFAPVLAGFDRSGRLGGRDAVEEAEAISADDLKRRMPHLIDHEKRLDAKHPERKWLDNYEYGSDNTAWDLAAILHAWKGKEADAFAVIGLVKGQTGEQLAAISPDHPAAVAELIVNRWPATKGRAAQIEKDLGGNPQVAYALARAYRSEKRFDDAARLLQSAIDISPDAAIYEELADLYKDQGNVDKWLEVSEKYLKNTEDFGLDHARRNEEIATELMRMKRPDRALPYAKAAAESYSSWGLRVHAVCLGQLGRFDEAEGIEKARQERYPNSFAWYRWCQLTGRGDLAGARAMSAATAEELSKSTNDDVLNEVAVYYAMEGDLKRAEQCWSGAGGQPWIAMQLALITLERGDSAKATELCERAGQASQPMQLPAQLMERIGNVTPADTSRMAAYAAAGEELARCLADPKAVPARDMPAMSDPKSVGKAYRGMIAYFFGRFCELRGQKDDALFWYRTARDNPEWNNTAAPQTAAGLRRLGDAYFK